MNGPITSSIGGTLHYYEALGQTGSARRSSKARPVGGDHDLGNQLLGELAPFIYRRTLDYTMIADLESMKARVEEQERVKGRDERNVKLGAGGIREVEFLVQSFAMVHGGRTVACASAALASLLRAARRRPAARGGGRALADAYVWLRRVEHALQIDEDGRCTIRCRRIPRASRSSRAGSDCISQAGTDLAAHRQSAMRRRASPTSTRTTPRSCAPRSRSLPAAPRGHRALGGRGGAHAHRRARRRRRRAARRGRSASPPGRARGAAPDPVTARRTRARPPRAAALAALAPALLTAVRRTVAPDRALAHLAGVPHARRRAADVPRAAGREQGHARAAGHAVRDQRLPRAARAP